jgi:hypothetical protein
MSRHGTRLLGGLWAVIVLAGGAVLALFAPPARAGVINLGACNTSALASRSPPGAIWPTTSWRLAGILRLRPGR